VIKYTTGCYVSRAFVERQYLLQQAVNLIQVHNTDT
jgi:hypothetical protein